MNVDNAHRREENNIMFIAVVASLRVCFFFLRNFQQNDVSMRRKDIHIYLLLRRCALSFDLSIHVGKSV